jgi:hypothetical protein
MRNMDRGARESLDVTQENASQFWLLTNEFEKSYSHFTAYVYAGTQDKVVIDAYLVEPNAGGIATTLTLVRLDSAVAEGIYSFKVPESKAHDRLLVFLTMKQASLKKIISAVPCRIRSAPL